MSFEKYMTLSFPPRMTVEKLELDGCLRPSNRYEFARIIFGRTLSNGFVRMTCNIISLINVIKLTSCFLKIVKTEQVSVSCTILCRAFVRWTCFALRQIFHQSNFLPEL